MSEENEAGLMRIINVQELAGSDKLLFRDEGEIFRNKIINEIHKANEIELVKIDLQGVKIVDVSFNREAFVKLISTLSIDVIRPQILFVNVTDYVKQNMHQDFNYHNSFAVIEVEKDVIELIGKYSPQMLETVRAMSKLKKANTKEVSKYLNGLELTATNNRLKSLYEMCVVSRHELGQTSGGKEYIYYFRS